MLPVGRRITGLGNYQNLRSLDQIRSQEKAKLERLNELLDTGLTDDEIVMEVQEGNDDGKPPYILPFSTSARKARDITPTINSDISVEVISIRGNSGNRRP